MGARRLPPAKPVRKAIVRRRVRTGEALPTRAEFEVRAKQDETKHCYADSDISEEVGGFYYGKTPPDVSDGEYWLNSDSMIMSILYPCGTWRCTAGTRYERPNIRTLYEFGGTDEYLSPLLILEDALFEITGDRRILNTFTENNISPSPILPDHTRPRSIYSYTPGFEVYDRFGRTVAPTLPSVEELLRSSSMWDSRTKPPPFEVVGISIQKLFDQIVLVVCDSFVGIGNLVRKIFRRG